MTGATQRSEGRARSPAGPRGRLLTGNLRDYFGDELKFLSRCAREHGDVVGLRFLNARAYLLNHPDHVEHVLVKNSRNFVKSTSKRHNLFLLGNGLLTSEGSFWRQQRRLLQPAFHRERISAYGDVMVECAERTISSWRDGEVRDVSEEMERLALEVVAKTLFRGVPDDEFEKIVAEISALIRRFAERGGWMFSSVRSRIPTPGNLLRLRRALRRLDDAVYEAIQRRRASAEDLSSRDGDLLSMLLRSRDEATGQGMSDKQLRDEVLTILLAGHDTAANALSWTWYLLGRHPEAEARLHEELRTVLAEQAPVPEDLPRLPYTGAVVKESLRLYPPVWAFGREALEDCEVGGYRVPAGTQLVLSPWVAHRDPRFFESPEEFRPERWLDGSTSGLPRYAYFPFGGGPRVCIGRSFATMESVLALATIAGRFRLAPVSGRPVAPIASITLRPEGSMKMRLAKR